MVPKIDFRVKKSIINLHSKKHSIRKIADELRISKSTVGRVIKHFKATNTISPRKKNGRPRKTSTREDRVIRKIALKDRFQTAASIARKVGTSHDIEVSRKTVSRRLNEIGLFARSPVKKPLISNKNKKLRLSFAQTHVLWTEEQWQNVFFSDESKFNLFGSDGNNFVRRFSGERLDKKCTKKTVKFGGGSVMVFGMMSAQGTGDLVRLNTRVNGTIYKNVLKDHVIPILRNSECEKPIFMQDNAPCHKAKHVMEFLKEQNVDVLDWPPQSPDLNPIENLWYTLGKKVSARNPTDTEDLWKKLKEEWSKISREDCRRLIQSCSRRCAAVIQNKGLFTKY